MHEKALLDDLMAKILQVADAEGGGAVRRITVWLGALSHFTPEHFRDHFAVAAAGTIAEGADVVATLDDDPTDSRAQSVVLESVEIGAELPGDEPADADARAR
jgi:hydrogenase nickel incorporation protein HypA/HybF